MLHTGDLIADLGMNPQFFFQFAPQSIPRLFTFFNLSPGKLPLQRHGLMSRPLADEYFGIFFNHRCYDPFHDSKTVAACRALATGSTQLVKVNAKAATLFARTHRSRGFLGLYLREL